LEEVNSIIACNNNRAFKDISFSPIILGLSLAFAVACYSEYCVADHNFDDENEIKSYLNASKHLKAD